MVYVELIFNLSLLVALSVVSGFIEKRWPRHTMAGVLLQGALFGAASGVGMLHPLNLGDGILFDGRSVMVSLCALFFGPWATAVAGVSVIAVRIALGGSGALTGSLVVMSSAGIGLLAHFHPEARSKAISVWKLYLLGVAVQSAMLAMMFTLPGGEGVHVIMRIGPTVMLLYPLATILAGKILSDQVEVKQSEESLKEAVLRQNEIIRSGNIGLWDWDLVTDKVHYSREWKKQIGYDEHEIEDDFEEWKRRVHPDDLDSTLERVHQSIAEDRTVYHVEFRFRHRAGSYLWILAQGSVFRDGTGRPVRMLGSHVDITESKNAELKLRQQSEILKTVVENIPVMISYLDQHGSHRWVNRYWQETLGWSLAEALNRNVLVELYPDPDYRQRVVNHIAEASGTWREFRSRAREGRLLDTLGANVLLQDGSRIGIGLDVTARKQSEEALQYQNRLLREMGTIAKIGGWEFDPATGKGTWTDEVARIHDLDPGVETDFEQGMSFYEGESRAKIETAVREALDSGKPYDLELELVSAKGVHKWVRTIGRPKIENGKLVQVRGAFQDITERKLTEQRVEHLNRVLLAIREVNQLIVHERDPQRLIREGCRLLVDNRGYASALIVLADENDRPVSWARAGIAAFSSLLPDMLEKGDLPPCCGRAGQDTGIEAITDRHDVCDKCPMAGCCSDTQSIYARMIHDGTAFGYLVASLDQNLKVDDEELSLFTEIAGDFAFALSALQKEKARRESERKRKLLEGQLIQAQKMESIGTLAGGIAHDFNNILTSIIGFTELALSEVEKGTYVEDSLQEVFAAGKRAKDLVKQILAFARQSDEELIPIQISLIAKEVLKFIRSSIPTTIEIRQHIVSDSLVMGNATQVHQMLMNLCTNAAQAMEEKGGIMELGVKDVVIEDREATEKMGLAGRDYIEISVSDTGTGIPDEIIGAIFEPYFTTKEPNEGTGMGLAVVHGIVESYGGIISVESTVDRGTVFTIRLPVTRKRNEPGPHESGIFPSGTERILFVDDEPAIAKMNSEILERLGYRVTIRTSSVEALELFRTRPGDFDLVITDLTMPAMTGDRLAVELISVRPDIPVILCTGYSKKISAETSAGLGIKAFAYKPVLKRELAETVRKVLDDAKTNMGDGGGGR